MKKTITYCNYCGKEFDFTDSILGFHAEQRLGFGSIYDGDLFYIDLCCGCLDRLIDSCKITPIEDVETFDTNGLDDIVYTADHTVACTTMPDGNTDPYQIPMEA